jgi:hypothetical protein
MAERTEADTNGAARWSDRQPRFTIIVCVIFALIFGLGESGLVRGDRLGWSSGSIGFYLIVTALYGVVANVVYELLAKSEALVKPREPATYRRRAFALAVALGVVAPFVLMILM